MPGMHQYEVVGRMKPSEKKPLTQVFRMRVFAANEVVARSRFWYYMAGLRRVKRSNGEVLSTREIFEKRPTSINNYGFYLRYDSRSGTHNMYREYRALSLNDAVDKMYSEMASRHRARRSSVQIVRTTVLNASQCKREGVKMFHDNGINFKLFHRISRASHPRHRATFKAHRPTTFF